MASFPAVRFLDRTTPPHIVTLILVSGVLVGVLVSAHPL